MQLQLHLFISNAYILFLMERLKYCFRMSISQANLLHLQAFISWHLSNSSF